jgi:hypothetical protein
MAKPDVIGPLTTYWGRSSRQPWNWRPHQRGVRGAKIKIGRARSPVAPENPHEPAASSATKIEPAVLTFLNSDTAAHWAEKTLGL